MVAVAALAVTFSLMNLLYHAGDKEPVPTNAVEALAYAVRCARERERDFHLEDYDAEVIRLKPGALTGIFRVTFVKKDERGVPTREISYAIQSYGYCMEVVRVRTPSPSGVPESE
jgi:hypothetical protein